MDRVHAKFDRIRTLFFPRWDRKREWKLHVVENPEYWERGDGFCVFKTKTIRIMKGRNEARDDCLLIHEIVHAVTGRGHCSAAFRRRLQKAADRAASLGMSDLAARLEEEVEVLGRGGEKLSYERIRDVLWDLPKASYEDVVWSLTRQCCISPEDFAKRLPYARQV